MIGINDYKEDNNSTLKLKPLKGCVKDVQNIKKVLIEKCGFNEENIYSIESSEENHETEIWNKFYLFLDKISDSFIRGKDSIYFHFSGHGVLNETASNIMLHNSPLEVTRIPELIIQRIEPQVQFYTFDCCHCGESNYTRGEKENYKLSDYFKKSSGLYILYACKKNQVAFETEEGGKLTNTIIKIISDLKYYDKDKILSAGALVEQVKKEMLEDKQEPIGISDSTGYYPFSTKKFWLSEHVDENIKRESKKIVNREDVNINCDEICNQRHEIIVEFFKIILKSLDEVFNEQKIHYFDSKFEEGMLKKVYESLKWKPLESGLEKKMLIEKSVLAFSVFRPNDIKYKYSLKIDSRSKLIYYFFNGKFKNTFGIGFIILPVKFGVSISMILTKKKFGEEEEIENTNYFFDALKLKEDEKEKFYLFIKEKIKEKIEEQQQINEEYDEDLLVEYSEFQGDIIKL